MLHLLPTQILLDGSFHEILLDGQVSVKNKQVQNILRMYTRIGKEINWFRETESNYIKIIRLSH